MSALSTGPVLDLSTGPGCISCYFIAAVLLNPLLMYIIRGFPVYFSLNYSYYHDILSAQRLFHPKIDARSEALAAKVAAKVAAAPTSSERGGNNSGGGGSSGGGGGGANPVVAHGEEGREAAVGSSGEERVSLLYQARKRSEQLIFDRLTIPYGIES